MRPSKDVIKIATASTLSGEEATLGEGIKFGAQLAVKQLAKSLTDLGFKVQVVPFDDQARPNIAVQQAKAIVADPDILVVIGHFNSDAALAASDFLKPYFGGSRGVELIPKPYLGTFEFATPKELYYLILAGCLFVALIATRLKNSRIGRAWIAMREDEDVAQSMGINLVATKLLAFGMGASFAGIAGAINASKLAIIYPHSFNLLVSINVLALIILGGMGSIPGVIVGALALVGLPELFREFSDFRLMVYGAVLVLMMLVRPEGLWPESRRRMELEEAREEAETEPALVGASGK